MKRHLIFIAMLTCILALAAKVVRLDESTRFAVPDDVHQTAAEADEMVWQGESADVSVTVKSAKHTLYDITKIRAHGDTLKYPELKDAELIDIDHESFVRWARNYETHIYREANGDTVYTYHTLGELPYIFKIKAHTPIGQKQAEEMMESITNDAWFSNAALLWSTLIVVLLFFILIMTEKDSSFSLKQFAIRLVSIILTCAVFGIAVCWGDWGAYLSYMIFISCFATAVLALNKPLRWMILHHGDDEHRYLIPRHVHGKEKKPKQGQ